MELPMGKVEAELRRVGVRWWAVTLPQAADVFEGAIVSLVLEREGWTCLGDIAEDVMSEAIEAAAALGL